MARAAPWSEVRSSGLRVAGMLQRCLTLGSRMLLIQKKQYHTLQVSP